MLSNEKSYPGSGVKGAQRQLSYLPEAEADVLEYERGDLYRGDVVKGPAIIREPDATTMVCAGQTATVGKYGEIRIERKA